jgi:threonine dehydratase
MTTSDALTLDEIRATATVIRPHIRTTPIFTDAHVTFKLELLQRTGTFKIRGALSNMLQLSADQRHRGVTAVSAGNHAIAVACAASILNLSAKVVMLATASPARIAAARAHGAEVLIAENGPAGFELANHIAAVEGRTFIHPFEGKHTALGTATLGLEFAEQAPNLDALIVAIGGGGLAAGVASAFKLLQPACRIYGVEPTGADTMHRSFAANAPQRIDRTATIADSLAPPMALPYSFALCKANVDELVKVNDDQLCRAMAFMFTHLKLCVEPAGAAALAALREPLSATLAGKNVGVIVCGSNIDIDTFARYVRVGEGREKLQ